MPYPAPYWAALECHDGDPFALLEETEVPVVTDETGVTPGVFAVTDQVDQSRTQTIVKPEHMPEEYEKLFLYGSRLAEEKKLLPAFTILSPQEAAQIPRERAFNQSTSGLRSEPIYLKLPPLGLPSFPHATVARMDKEVNGVVSGPAAWRATFAAYCKELGFEIQAHRTSPCTFIFRESMWRSWSGVYFCSKGEALQHDAKRPHDDYLCVGRRHSWWRERTEIPRSDAEVEEQ
eukprot:4954500-Amphidinium_carterae.2